MMARGKDTARPSRNQSPWAADDTYQRMKSANGFLMEYFYISWNLSSVGKRTPEAKNCEIRNKNPLARPPPLTYVVGL